ncbi:ribosomal L7Ae/L30e/S12e/Gadd45 family protein [Natranaerobius thermophilus JW/NM-WN-LF]|uniref:Ribosomal protein L7Ae/L30e/S12e/Gadd45 n=2 Tax=Natranaerobius TaxID=375928 RepID=B2A396_NATTJ|nr:ribosomal protein L7Ae/L30e/S12e/Gadd45 [Natranaerobius thermophilus JW/NM-WN-LF]
MMKNDNKVGQLLGIARKSGQIALGSRETLTKVREGHCVLVIVAEDAGFRTKKMLTDKCTHYSVTFKIWGCSNELAKYLGKSRVSVVGINNKGMANKLLSLLNDN